MAKILLVHGAFHELWGPNEIKTRWLPALRDGLWHHGAEIDERDVTAAFYGDLFRPDPEVDDTATVAAARQAGADALAGHIPGGAEALPAIEEAMGKVMLARIEYLAGKLGTDPGIETAAVGRVVERLEPETEIVVAHSLGTLVAFAALRRNPDVGIPLLVTLGSPLGAPFIQQRVADEIVDGVAPWPGGVERWVNVAAVGDMACVEPRLANLWGPRVQDHRVDNGHRAHDVEPYLNARVTGAAITAALLGE
jgi:pimeloyl-ACP methyl ester carboxylesterase